MTRKVSLLILLVSCLILGACTQTSINGVDMPKPNSAIKARAAANDNVNLGIQYLQEGKVTQAKSRLLQALKEAPRFPASWYSMAYFLEVTGNNELAKEYYQRAIDLDPQDGDTHNNYGTFLCRHKHYQEAVDQFVTAAKNITYLDSGRAYENAGLCSMLIPDKKNAVAYFKLALKNDLNRRASMFELARLYYKQGKVKQSRYYFNQYAMLTKTKKTKFVTMMTQRQRRTLQNKGI